MKNWINVGKTNLRLLLHSKPVNKGFIADQEHSVSLSKNRAYTYFLCKASAFQSTVHGLTLLDLQHPSPNEPR